MTLSSPRVMIRDMTLNRTRIRAGRTATIKNSALLIRQAVKCGEQGWTGFVARNRSPNVIPVRHLLYSFDTRSPSALYGPSMKWDYKKMG